MKKLIKKGFSRDDIISYGNMFLIGNGHLGYRGTLEEYGKEQMVGLNVVGFYDRYQKLWRESINLPNPFFIEASLDEESLSVLKQVPLHHQMILAIDDGVFQRKSTFFHAEIQSERFISQSVDQLICFSYTIRLKKDGIIRLRIGTDTDIYEINGPHFSSLKVKTEKNRVTVEGITNEKKTLTQVNQYCFPRQSQVTFQPEQGMYQVEISGKTDQLYHFYCFSSLVENDQKRTFPLYHAKDYAVLKKQHIQIFHQRWLQAGVQLTGDKKAQFALSYSIYHLLILGNPNYQTSIPARGVSGQTYKGAIFWDTEIFLLPFFTLTDPSVAKQLLLYRIKTLDGALKKARQNGYQGAFYAWESQEKGQEGCSKYNVSDPRTNRPVRTYFGEKQIHISADIAYAFLQYMQISGDETLLDDRGVNLLCQINEFYLSYATFRNGQYHLDDVIGPDEYHERVNDNAFTNYLVHFVLKESIPYLKKKQVSEKILARYEHFADHLYLPPVDEQNRIEQFEGYYQKEDVFVDVVRSRLKYQNEYWGTKNGVAFPTRVIKQADVVTLLVLLGNRFSSAVKKSNFDFYYPYTEHGSSLSASMYSILAAQLNRTDIAYQMFLKSATIDLGTDQKMFAGGIYIGGTHPASNAGAYLSLVFGMCGLSFNDQKISLTPHLPDSIKKVSFTIFYRQEKYHIEVEKEHYEVKKIS